MVLEEYASCRSQESRFIVWGLSLSRARNGCYQKIFIRLEMHGRKRGESTTTLFDVACVLTKPRISGTKVVERVMRVRGSKIWCSTVRGASVPKGCQKGVTGAIGDDAFIAINSMFGQIAARAAHLGGGSSSSSRKQAMAAIGTKTGVKEKRKRKRRRRRRRTRKTTRRVARRAAGATRKRTLPFSMGTTV